MGYFPKIWVRIKGGFDPSFCAKRKYPNHNTDRIAFIDAMSRENKNKKALLGLDTLGQRLRFAREKLNLTQEECARKAGIWVQTWRKYEAGKAEPGVIKLYFLAREYKVSINWLLTGEGPMFLEEREGRAKVINFEDERLKQMFDYLRERWEGADLKERRFIELEFSRAFHDYVDWLKKQEGAEEKAE